ncbi:MAG TPA: hypothetical protein VJ719_08905 [Chthoniobacterales bacterium]|nr:hypothetical protein [Chthoniobacterales bacterium]
MRYILAIVFMLALAGVASAQTYRSPIGRQEPVRPTGVKPPPVSETRQFEGSIPAGVRGGNPLQMLNPKAPAQYGTAWEHVIYEPYTWKWRGIKLFEIVW